MPDNSAVRASRAKYIDSVDAAGQEIIGPAHGFPPPGPCPESLCSGADPTTSAELCQWCRRQLAEPQMADLSNLYWTGREAVRHAAAVGVLSRLPDQRRRPPSWYGLCLGWRFGGGNMVMELLSDLIGACQLPVTPLPPLAGDAAGAGVKARALNDTDQKILLHCRRRGHKGERIAHHVGLSIDHTRRVLARLTRENRLRKTTDGYRTV
jgi:hypothetical protein